MSKYTQLMMASILMTGIGQTAFAHDLNMTIYGNNRALIEDHRMIDFKAGEQVIPLSGVSSLIEPTTVSFLADDITILEQNFDFDLITPTKLMEKAVGSHVEIIRTNPSTGEETRHKAKVLSVNNGVVIEIDGHIEILRDDDIPTRVIFNEIPENLRANPTLSVSVDSETESHRPIQFSYLTSGLSWSVDYIANFNEDEETLALQAWATINNLTKTDFEDAEISVLAANAQNANSQNYNRYNHNQQNLFNRYSNMRGQNYNTAFNQLRQSGLVTHNTSVLNIGESLGDGYLFRLPGLIDLKSAQKKQISILDVKTLGAKKTYEYSALGFYVPPAPVSADVRLTFENTKANHLGLGLPSGIIRVYVKDSEGRSQFTGENTVGHTPEGETISIKTGEAFDVRVTGKVNSLSTNRHQPIEADMSYTITNSKNEDVTVNLRQIIPGGNHEMLEETQESVKEDAFTRLWKVDVPAGGETVVTFKVRKPR